MLRRYRSWIIGPLFAGLVSSVVIAFLWPDTYVSTAVLRITPPQVPERLVPSNINTQMAERLTAMQQEILSRSSLTELIQRPSLDLYRKERQRKPLEDTVEAMRRDVKIAVLDTPSQAVPSRYASAFQITFAYIDRYKAQAVVRELVTKFTEQNVTVLRNQANLTTSFLNDELKVAKTALDGLDKEITKFKVQNSGRLPEQLQSNLQALNSLQLQLASVNEALNRNAQEKMMLETQLQNLKGQTDFINAGAEQNSSAQAFKNERIIQMDKVILEAESSLSAARETYKEDHPDIRSLKARLKVLRAERDAMEKADQAEQAKNAPAKKVASPQMAKSLEEVKMAVSNVQAQIKAKNLDIEERMKQQGEIQKALGTYQSRIEVSPINEQRYAALLRDYQLAKAKYDEMNQKKAISETASNLEERKAGENLEVLDPASLPEQPSDPNRLMITGVGCGLGLMLGLFLAGVKEVKNTSLKNLKDVRAYTNLAVLSSIPLLENALLVRRKRRLFWLAWASVMIIGTVAMSGSMYLYYFGRT